LSVALLADDCPANPVAGIFKKNGEQFTFYPGEKAGMRAGVKPFL
jgi:hypothetical protein